MDRTDIGTLLIPNIKMSDAGTYMCVGSNNIGSNSSPIKVTVHKGELSNMISQVRNTLLLLHFIFCLSSFKWIQGPYKWKLRDYKPQFDFFFFSLPFLNLILTLGQKKHTDIDIGLET